jgi:hypothetical protein
MKKDELKEMFFKNELTSKMSNDIIGGSCYCPTNANVNSYNACTEGDIGCCDNDTRKATRIDKRGCPME